MLGGSFYVFKKQECYYSARAKEEPGCGHRTGVQSAGMLKGWVLPGTMPAPLLPLLTLSLPCIRTRPPPSSLLHGFLLLLTLLTFESVLALLMRSPGYPISVHITGLQVTEERFLVEQGRVISMGSTPGRILTLSLIRRKCRLVIRILNGK